MPSAGLFLTLSDYRTQTRRLLRDSTGALYTDSDLTEFINRAMRQRDEDLGYNRLLMSFTLVASTFRYSYSTIASGGAVLIGSASAVIQNVRSIIIMPLGGATSSVRYPLGRWPYSKLAFLLSTSFPTYPVVYALYGPSTIVLAPPPAGNYAAEFDFIAYSTDLVATSDQDILPYPYTDLVPFMAASFAKVQAQRFDEANQFEEQYMKRLMRVRGHVRDFAVANPLSDIPMRRR